MSLAPTGSTVRSVIPAAPPVGVAGVDPTVAVDAPGPVRATAAFLFLLVAGAALVSTRPGLVERATDATLDRPLAAVVYGAVAHALVVLLGGYGVSQLVRVAPAGPVATAALALVALALGVLATLGFVVVGAALTEVAADRNPWTGVVVGASLGAVLALLPVVPLGAAAWLAVASVGIGGTTREWVHADRAETELR